MLAKAGQTYSGPEGLDTTQASQDAEAANQQLNAIGSAGGVQALVNQGQSGTAGADALSGSLINAAGRKDFDGLRARFNPSKDILDAQKAAGETAKKAKADSETNAKAWGSQAQAAKATKDEMDANNAKNDAAAKANREKPGAADPVATTPEEMQDPRYGIDKTNPQAVAKRAGEMAEFQKAMATNASDHIRSGLSDASIVSRLWEAGGGGNDPFTGAAQGLHMKTEGDKPNDSGGIGQHIWWKPGHFYVYQQMTPDQWQELRSLTPRQQGTWLDSKAEQLRSDARLKKATTSTQATGVKRSG